MKQGRPSENSRKIPDQLFCFGCNLNLTNSTQFGNDSNYRKFKGENIGTICSVVTVLALDGLTKKQFGHYAVLKISPQISKKCFTSYSVITFYVLSLLFMYQTDDNDRFKHYMSLSLVAWLCQLFSIFVAITCFIFS